MGAVELMGKVDVVGDTNIKLVLVIDWMRGVRYFDFCWERKAVLFNSIGDIRGGNSLQGRESFDFHVLNLKYRRSANHGK